ncbi:MAG TPA: YceI family protein [Gammaproteobacteria bacterium]
MKGVLAGLVTSWLACGVAAGQEVYRVDGEASDVHWRIYSAGTFARLGHNHVISAGELSGTATVTDGRASFEIEIPVEALVVDDPELRARYGEAFSSKPSEDDIAGTRRNMLGERVLDAEQHPLIRIVGSGPVEPGATTLDVTFEIRGQTTRHAVPATVTVDDDAIVAEGEFQLTHEQLGLAPFKVMMGALQVAEQIDFAYRLRAVRAAGASSP